MRDRSRDAALAVALTWAALAALGAAAACADFEPVNDATRGVPDVVVQQPVFERDVQPIFTKRCAVGGCHSAATRQFGLTLEAGFARAAVVNQRAHSSPGPDTVLLVKPGDHTNSWLWRRIQPDPSLRAGLPRMPLAATPLTANQIATIANWIDEGAP